MDSGYDSLVRKQENCPDRDWKLAEDDVESKTKNGGRRGGEKRPHIQTDCI